MRDCSRWPGPELDIGPGPELDIGPVEEVERSIADVVSPVAISPDRMLPGDVADALEEIEALRTLRASAEAREFALIGHAATVAPSSPGQQELPGREQQVDLGGDGCPTVAEFVVLEIAALLHMSHTSARALIADALSVRHRHPRMWQAVMAARLPVWQARKIAQAVRAAGLDRTAALRVDRALAPALGAVSWTRLEALVEGEIVTADPARAARAEERAATATFARLVRDDRGTAGVRTLIGRLRTPDALQLDATLARLAGVLARQGDTDDLDVRRARALGILATPERALDLLTGGGGSADRLKPAVRLYVHVNAERLGPEGVARLEGEGAVPVVALRALLADCTVRVTGVIDHRASEPVDAYEIPDRLREQVLLAHPYEVFPWGTRRSRHADLDHTDPYRTGQGIGTDAAGSDAGTPRGQTRVENLGPLGRTAHRAKTHAGWRCRQTAPGHWLWRSPFGRDYEVDNWGTRTPTTLAAIPSTTEQRALRRIMEKPVQAERPERTEQPLRKTRRKRRSGKRRPRGSRSRRVTRSTTPPWPLPLG